MEKNTDIRRGKRIAALRKDRNMSQTDLAGAMEISRQALANIEAGGDFRVSCLTSMAAALDIMPGEILYDRAEGNASLIDDINEELREMDELELPKLLAGIRAVKGII